MLCFCRDGNRALQRGLTTDADGLVPGTLNVAWTLGVIVARWSRGRRFASSTSSTDDIDARSSASSRQVLARSRFEMIACVSASPLGQLGRSFSWVFAGKGVAESRFCCLTVLLSHY